MATTMDYISQLKEDKKNLVSMLNSMGVEATDSDTFTSLTPKVGKIVTDPILQDKSVEITENGTTNIVADNGYDGLNNVDITVNVASSGGEEPTIGFTVNEWDNQGYPLSIKTFGFITIPNYYFSDYNTTYSHLLKNVKKIELNDGITKFGTMPFYNLQNLETVKLPSNIGNNGDFGYQTFNGCTKLNLESLPEGIKILSNMNFQNCTSLTIKKLPNSLTRILTSVFSGCTSLTQLSMPGVAELSGSAASYATFRNCTNLKAVWIGNPNTNNIANSLGRYCFSGCTSMTRMFINAPRSIIEASSTYTYAFMNDTTKTGIIICNDDEGWMTQEEFDSINWEEHTE